MEKHEGKAIIDEYDHYGEEFSDYYIENINDEKDFKSVNEIMKKYVGKNIRITIEEI